MKIGVEFEISTGHTLWGVGKCHNFHGHNYLIQLELKGEIVRKTGMVVNFTDLKRDLVKMITDLCDHRFFIHIDDPRADKIRGIEGVRIVRWIPTVENFAIEIRDVIRQHNVFGGYPVKVTVYETRDCYASV